MANKMLIDAAHPEETRVVVLRGNRVEEFDHESLNRRQLRGNIYLAKVTRVEPSLQAAFVDFGGNRHGFLAFSEIHPDYYQIPVADRQALLEEEAEEASRAEAEEAAVDAKNARARSTKKDDKGSDSELIGEGHATASTTDSPEIALEATQADDTVTSEPVETDADDGEQEKSDDNGDNAAEQNASSEAEDVESVGSEDVLEEVPHRVRRRRRTYKIQEVIKRRQVILVQVVKEERGNKGAALTTYLSLAGRYTVLMPNTARGGGISRKITNHTDRKRLRKIAAELEVPQGMGLIIRTAGAARTKAEIKRDHEYLLRLWENVRDLTLGSTAPSLVYEEGSLIKRSIRDLYSKEIEEILVAGDEAYREAKDFMRMLMPSHAKNVQPYKDPDPLFIRHRIERQLNSMFSPYVTLRSGGYIVINQTEALVSVDVNSGKATKEHSIEETAVKTNLEAADEVARQLRLRDLAGLIVIDFIDMDERRNNRAVERRIKDALRNDRARIQIGRISHFGLLEMSRQRLRPGVLEGSTVQCPHCQGTGMIRSTESVALSVLRALEDTLLTGKPCDLMATTAVDVALYILNQKRPYLKDIEARYNAGITVIANAELHGANYSVERIERQDAAGSTERSSGVQMDWAHHEPHADTTERGTERSNERNAEGGEGEKKRPRRRRGRGRGRPEANSETTPSTEPTNQAVEAVEASAEQAENGSAERQPREEGGERRPRRRGRRGGRRNRSAAARERAEGQPENVEGNADAADQPASAAAPAPEATAPGSEAQPAADQSAPDQAAPVQATSDEQSAETEDKPKRPRRRPRQARVRADTPAADVKTSEAGNGEDAVPAKKEAPASAAKSTTKASDNGDNAEASVAVANVASQAPTADAPEGKTKRGWWQR